MPPSSVDLGIVEGYYGRPWSWSERERVVARIAPAGYRFFLYAPKAATALRRRWREPVTAAVCALRQAIHAGGAQSAVPRWG